MNLNTFITNEPGTLTTESLAVGGDLVHNSHFTSTLPCVLCRVVTLVLRNCFEVVHTSLWESGLTATFRAMEGLARLCPEGQLDDALLGSSEDKGEP